MNRYHWLTVAAIACAFAWCPTAEADTLASSLGIFIYPTSNQSTEQQSEDDSACYMWAKGQTGYDPINPTQVTAATPSQGPTGARVGGAARGAAAGALIGEIASDDAGKGAAIGATLGVLGGGRRERQARAAQAQQAEQAAAQENAAIQGSFKKAYAACIEARGYTATY